MSNYKIHTTLAAGLLASAISTVTQAQDDGWRFEEIVVTAQKRAQSSQDVPIALSAYTGDHLKQIGAADFKGLTNMTPGFSVSGGSDAFPRSYIRGIGSNDTGIGADPSVGVYIDGIYASRNGGALTELMDIARIEVLKGPQGTLFGRNSIGGAISIVTEETSEELNGEISMELGKYDNQHAKGIINLPLIEDTLYLRASGSIQQRDGWQENTEGGEYGNSRDRANGRLKLTWLPSEAVEVDFSSNWGRIDEMSAYTENMRKLSLAAGVPAYAPSTSKTGDHTSANGNRDLLFRLGLKPSANDLTAVEPILERQLRQHSVIVKWEFNDELTLSSLSSYRTFTTTSASDYDGTEYLLGNNDKSIEFNESISQELRLTSSSDRLDWFVGVSAAHERNSMDFTVSLIDAGALDPSLAGGPLNNGNPFSESSFVSSSVDSYALYGDLTWQATDRLNLTFGARYSIDEKEIHYDNPIQTDGAALFGGAGFLMPSGLQFVDANGIPDPSMQEREDNWSNFSPRLVLDYALTESAMVYLSATKGYKSGGFNTYPTPDPSNFLFVTPAATESFDPELATNYEFGIKSTWFDQRLMLNASIFYLNYQDLQVRQITNNLVQIKNAGKASNNGMELDIKYLVSENLTLLANATWMDAEYVEYSMGGADLSGTPLLFSPNFSGSLALDHSWMVEGIGDVRSFVSYSYKGKHLVHEGIEQEGYAVVDARVALTTEDEQWEFAMFANNLTDKSYLTNYVGQMESFGFSAGYRNTPRTYGVSASYRF
jgi:iron complex outermembrane receptor protein